MYLRGKRYETEKKLYGGQGGNRFKKIQVSRNETPVQTRTDNRIGAEYGVGRSTIMRDFQFSKAIDAMPPETKEKILSGDLSVSKREMMNLHRMDVSSSKRVNLWVSNLAKMKILTRSIKQQYFDEIMAGTKTEEYRQIKASTVDRYITYKIGDQILTSNKGLTAKQIQDAELVPVKYDAIKLLTGAYSGKRPWAIVEVEDSIIDGIHIQMIYRLGEVLERSEY